MIGFGWSDGVVRQQRRNSPKRSRGTCKCIQLLAHFFIDTWSLIPGGGDARAEPIGGAANTEKGCRRLARSRGLLEGPWKDFGSRGSDAELGSRIRWHMGQ